MCAATSLRLGEEDVEAWNIVEQKCPYERRIQKSDSNCSYNPLPFTVLYTLQVAKKPTKRCAIHLIEQASSFLEQSMAYYHCQRQPSQNVLVRK